MDGAGQTAIDVGGLLVHLSIIHGVMQVANGGIKKSTGFTAQYYNHRLRKRLSTSLTIISD